VHKLSVLRFLVKKSKNIFQIGISEDKLLKRSGPDVDCHAIEEGNMVFKMHVTFERCCISNDETMDIL
jgi:hypothetical protein